MTVKRRDTPPVGGPDLALERTLTGRVAGVDEAGRAPLAGPVVAAAVILPDNADREPRLSGIDDSKRLSKARREEMSAHIRDLALVGVGAASTREIDRLNILRASLLAMARAVAALPARPDGALVDGKQLPPLPCPALPVVGGDRRCLSVAAASIIAKVLRDLLMTRLDHRHPGYGWATNNGYPTDDHYLGLARQGITRHHRRTFAPIPLLMAEPGFGLRFGPVSPPDPDGLVTVRLRADLYALCDGDRQFLGTLKGRRGAWVLCATGYEATGAPIVGGGPLAAFHGRSMPSPDAAAVRVLLTADDL